MYCKVFFMLYLRTCRNWFPDQELNPRPLHRKCGVLTNGTTREVPVLLQTYDKILVS